MGDAAGLTPEPHSCLQLGMGWFPEEVGGLNRYFRGLTEALAHEGVNVRAVVRGPAVGPPGDFSLDVVAPGSLISVLRRYAAVAGLGPPPEIVDSHFALYALLPVVAGRLRGLPLVLHFHGPWGAEGQAEGQRLPRTTAKRMAERAVYRHARETIVLSRAFARVLVEQYGVLPWHVNVVPPGVDLDRFSPGSRAASRRTLGLPETGWIAVTTRRLVARMGVDVLIDAWRSVADDGRLLLIVGEGPARESLEELVARHRLEDSVRFFGPVDEGTLVSCYRAADLSIVPSRSLEGFGLVAAESLACGTPVVVTDVGGLPEAVSGLECDLVVQGGDAEALAARLNAAADGSRPLPASSVCRSHAERFTWSRAVEAHRDVYRRAVDQSRRLPLRVVYLGHTAALSGGELALLRLLAALEGVDAHVILAEHGPLVHRLEAIGVSVEVMPLGNSARKITRHAIGAASLFGPGALATGVYSLRLARRLRRLRPDLVHTNSLKAALYGGAAGKLAGVPVVWHIRDRIAPDYLGVRATSIVRRAARRLPDVVIANSGTTLAELGVDGYVIPSPVPPIRDLSRNGERPFTAGMVGRIARWKGQHIFLEAFARAFPDGDERAIVVGAPLFGRDDERYERELHALANSLGLESRVIFTGFVEDVPRWLEQFDVLVHASVLPEPFGQVVVEGMAAGLPVVASNAGGPAEIVEDGVQGFLISPGDIDALSEVLAHLEREPGLRAQTGERGQERARQFRPEVVAADVMRTYKRVVRV
jgi:glycosyltransferase involved in cell wall biosynthesis